MSKLLCEYHGIEKEPLGGCSAHFDNWVCPKCEEEQRIGKYSNRHPKESRWVHEDDVKQEIDKLRQERDRLLVLATKWCDKTHHDWQEILRIAGEVEHCAEVGICRLCGEKKSLMHQQPICYDCY